MLEKVSELNNTRESLKTFDKDGVIFIGMSRDPVRNGLARTINVRKEYLFEGIYVNDQKRYGREIFKDGSWYQGYFKNKKRHGEGKLCKSKGEI